jgi:hypothetical protein
MNSDSKQIYPTSCEREEQRAKTLEWQSHKCILPYAAHPWISGMKIPAD